MKKFESMYKKQFDNIQLSKREVVDIKEKIDENKSKKFIFKPAYVTSLVICIIVIGII